MATVGSLLTDLARITRPDKAAVWDQVGLQVGAVEASVARVGVCHEVTEAVIAAVEADRPDLVLSYHPLLFRPTARLVAGPTPAGRAFRLARAGVSLIVTHTDFDTASGGSADALAETVGLRHPVPFGPVEPSGQVTVVTFVPPEAVEAAVSAMGAAGAGRVGNYEGCSFRTVGEGSFYAGAGSSPSHGRPGAFNTEPEVRVEMVAPRGSEAAVVAALVATHPYEEPVFHVSDVRANLGFTGRVGSWGGTLRELAGLVVERMGGAGLRVAGDVDAHLDRVAVVPGSGSSLMDAARRAGAGAIITGDVDHHRAVAAVDAGLAVVDPGHAATELAGVRRLLDIVSRLGVDVMDLTGDGRGPWVEVSRKSLP